MTEWDKGFMWGTIGTVVWSLVISFLKGLFGGKK